MLSPSALKEKACQAIDESVAELKAIGDIIWQTPELQFEEHFAHETITEFLEKRNFPVERNFILKTGFRSVYKTTTNAANQELPNIAIVCEYDALPDIGHACGHNLIAELGLGAALGIKAALDTAKEAGRHIGTLTVLGTPAEECLCGKAPMIAGGALEAVDVAMMAHPGPWDHFRPAMLAMTRCDVTYKGKASHAAAFPWEGVNALDAAVLAYTNISVLRQQMKPTWRVHGIITAGGTKPNIIPEKTSMEAIIRAPLTKDLSLLRNKVEYCFNAAAEATGCQVEVRWDTNSYEHLITNDTLASLFDTNVDSISYERTEIPPSEADRPTGSTDMGNISQKVPTIHPMYHIGGINVNHTRGFTDDTGKSRAQSYTISMAKLLAMTAIDVYCNPELVDRMKTELQQDLSN